MLKKIIILSLLVFLIRTLAYADAGGSGADTSAEYKLLAPIGTLKTLSPYGDSFSFYLQRIVNISIAVAGAISVLILIIGGLQYILSSVNETAKKDAKDKITNAVFGLLIALSGVLLLQTINPDLLKLGLPPIPKSEEIKQATKPPSTR
jgi:uncharacterized membrane protein